MQASKTQKHVQNMIKQTSARSRAQTVFSILTKNKHKFLIPQSNAVIH